MIYDVDETDWNVYLSAVATIYSFDLATDADEQEAIDNLNQLYEEKNQC